MIARTTLGRSVAIVLSIVISQVAAPAAHAAAPSHVVDPQQVAARLGERAAEREAQLHLVRDVLATAEAQKQARVMGLSADKMRGAVAHLSDSELRDLSQRAAQVKDLAAGHHGDDGLVILAVILLVAGVAILVAASGSDYYDDCYCY